MKKLFRYISEVRHEMSKVTWPSRPQVMESTGIALMLSAMIALFIFFVDQIVSRLINFII
jgi:preprotein translocase subunit SecE